MLRDSVTLFLLFCLCGCETMCVYGQTGTAGAIPDLDDIRAAVESSSALRVSLVSADGDRGEVLVLHHNGTECIVSLEAKEVIVSCGWRGCPSAEVFDRAQEALSEVVRVLSSVPLGSKQLSFGEAAWFSSGGEGKK